MNMPSDIQHNNEFESVFTAQTKLTVEQVNQAKKVSSQTKQALLDVLEEQSGLTADAFVIALGQLMHYPALTILQLYEMQPDFSLLSFANAGKYTCVALRNQSGDLYLVCANPFDVNLQGKVDLLCDADVILPVER